MKPTRSVRIGRICKKHPEENGLRYVGNSCCVECAKEASRKHYAGLELTPAQRITTLLAEISRLKTENEQLRTDALRWRFVRDPISSGSPFAIWSERTNLFLGKFADEAIDAAMEISTK